MPPAADGDGAHVQAEVSGPALDRQDCRRRQHHRAVDQHVRAEPHRRDGLARVDPGQVHPGGQRIARQRRGRRHVQVVRVGSGPGHHGPGPAGSGRRLEIGRGRGADDEGPVGGELRAGAPGAVDGADREVPGARGQRAVRVGGGQRRDVEREPGSARRVAIHGDVVARDPGRVVHGRRPGEFGRRVRRVADQRVRSRCQRGDRAGRRHVDLVADVAGRFPQERRAFGPPRPEAVEELLHRRHVVDQRDGEDLVKALDHDILDAVGRVVIVLVGVFDIAQQEADEAFGGEHVAVAGVTGGIQAIERILLRPRIQRGQPVQRFEAPRQQVGEPVRPAFGPGVVIGLRAGQAVAAVDFPRPAFQLLVAVAVAVVRRHGLAKRVDDVVPVFVHMRRVAPLEVDEQLRVRIGILIVVPGNVEVVKERIVGRPLFGRIDRGDERHITPGVSVDVAPGAGQVGQDVEHRHVVVV